MNSMSKKYSDCCEKEKQCEKNTCPTVLKCGCPRTTNITTATTYTVASVSVNLDGICDPKVRIDFSANLVVPATATAATLTFQLSKQYRCCPQLEPVGSTYTVTVPASTATSSTISFFVCDSDLCEDDCFSYVLTVTSSAATTATLANANLSIIATCDRHEKCCKQSRECNCGR